MKKIYVLLTLFLGLTILNSQAQSYTVLKNLSGVNTGKYPQRNLTLLGNHLYGMAAFGGLYGLGCIFTVDTSGNGFRDLYDFNSTNPNSPAQPEGSLIISGKVMYGMTPAGGVTGGGAIFSIDTDGTNFTVLHGFGGGSDGSQPRESLTLIGNTLFGTAEQGGTQSVGIIFSIKTNGSNYKVLLNFNDTNGAAPICNLVAQGKYLYGTGFYGGSATSILNGCVYRIDTNGTGDTVLHVFNSTDGANPFGSVTIVGSMLFGTTEFGGTGSMGTIYSMKTNGTNFKVLLNGGPGAGSLTGDPIISGATIYEMSPAGGVSGDGTVFSLDTNGTAFHTIMSFSGKTGSYLGTNPYGGLIMAGGTFYGMTQGGGTLDSGVVFKLRPGPTSVNELSTVENAIIAYPNPTNGTISFEFRNSLLHTKSILEIYNLLGEKISTQIFPAGQVLNNTDISTTPSGIYFYRVSSESGEVIGEGKFVKE